eukprot:797099-Prymnesium_polylepis.1
MAAPPRAKCIRPPSPSHPYPVTEGVCTLITSMRTGNTGYAHKYAHANVTMRTVSVMPDSTRALPRGARAATRKCAHAS